MAQLIVRNLDRRIVSALKTRAASRGRSAEAEHRDILEQVLLGGARAGDFKAFLRSMPASPDLDLARSRDTGRPVVL